MISQEVIFTYTYIYKDGMKNRSEKPFFRIGCDWERKKDAREYILERLFKTEIILK